MKLKSEFLTLVKRTFPWLFFSSSRKYWESRYCSGGNSGAGSYGQFAEFKAEVINKFIKEHSITSVIEFGCGDGNQLQFLKVPRFLGFDVSEAAIESCRLKFAHDPTKLFNKTDSYKGEKADLALSLDVIYHLVEEPVYQAYLKTLFDSAERFVIIYSSNTDDNKSFGGTHVRHRKFSDWIIHHRPAWQLKQRIPNKYPYSGDYTRGSWSDFFIYQKEVNEKGAISVP
jgi:hypothetical protein